MVFRLQLAMVIRLASVLVSVAAVTAAVAAVAAVAADIAAAAPPLLYRHLRPLHRRSECPKLHSLAQLSLELRQR